VHFEFLLNYGDKGIHYFEQFLNGKEISPGQFDYSKCFNRLGFYKTDLNVVESPTIDNNKWGIEEVTDLTASIDQWEIVEEPADQKAVKEATYDHEASTLLVVGFRDSLSSELEEVEPVD
jgi:hypothetical protein